MASRAMFAYRHTGTLPKDWYESNKLEIIRDVKDGKDGKNGERYNHDYAEVTSILGGRRKIKKEVLDTWDAETDEWLEMRDKLYEEEFETLLWNWKQEQYETMEEGEELYEGDIPYKDLRFEAERNVDRQLEKEGNEPPAEPEDWEYVDTIQEQVAQEFISILEQAGIKAKQQSSKGTISEYVYIPKKSNTNEQEEFYKVRISDHETPQTHIDDNDLNLVINTSNEAQDSITDFLNFLQSREIVDSISNLKIEDKEFVELKEDEVYFQGPDDELFKPTEEARTKYKESLEKALTDTKHNRKIEFGETPIVLQALELPNLPVISNKEVILKATGFKEYKNPHNVNQDDILKLVDLIHNPNAVIESSNGNFVLVLDIKDNSKRQVVLVVKAQGGNYHFVPTFYGHDEFQGWFQDHLQKGNVRYRNESSPEISDLVKPKSRNGLQSYNNRILTKTDIVKMFGKKERHSQGENKEAEPRARISFENEKAIIALMESSDKSSIVHELGHLFLKDIEKISKVSDDKRFFELKRKVDEFLKVEYDKDGNALYSKPYDEAAGEMFWTYCCPPEKSGALPKDLP